MTVRPVVTATWLRHVNRTLRVKAYVVPGWALSGSANVGAAPQERIDLFINKLRVGCHCSVIADDNHDLGGMSGVERAIAIPEHSQPVSFRNFTCGEDGSEVGYPGGGNDDSPRVNSY